MQNKGKIFIDYTKMQHPIIVNSRKNIYIMRHLFIGELKAFLVKTMNKFENYTYPQKKNNMEKKIIHIYI